MNSRIGIALKSMKTPVNNEKEKAEMQSRRIMDDEKATMSRRVSITKRKSALQKDIDKLKKKLRHEENVRRALERAFTRTLGALPLSPSLSATIHLNFLPKWLFWRRKLFG
ncbi:hypothetical protein Adt_23839 [Abeliophyllum distichum]|uniref:Ternary complex factor MIP1 leucine-zipper domain-containing protein n=1 Tax=Abeliophyllum distichum TaxID=126358 RepID=A0ABD1SBZ8_9LAMI